MLELLGGSRGHQGCIGDGRGCRYSGTRRCIGSIQGHRRATRGNQGCQGVLVAGRECRYLGAGRGIGGIRGHWGLLGSIGGH